MLDDVHFLAITGATLMHIHDQLEQAYDRGDLEDLDYDESTGILTITTPDNTTFLLSRHGPSGQLWLASPVSGGLHFEYNQQEQSWVLPDGRTLKAILAQELEQKAKIHVVL